MGELARLPDWLIATIFVVGGLAITFVLAWRNTQKQIAATLARRPNLSRSEFAALMSTDCSVEATNFLWDTALPYLEPHLTPHPDDDLVRDLPIDDDDWGMDWPRDYARLQGFDEKEFPDWPEGVPVTLRNFGRWLDRNLS